MVTEIVEIKVVEPKVKNWLNPKLQGRWILHHPSWPWYYIGYYDENGNFIKNKFYK